jgi:arylsulfatase A-like enzyme
MLACGLTAASLGLLLSCGERRSAVPPATSDHGSNVLLVSIDTLRADRLNAYGYERRETSPHLDALAREGILFENFITAAPWTTPAHLSLLTSLHPSTHGMTQPFFQMYDGLFGEREFFKLPEERVTMAEVLEDAGLRTVAFTAGGPLDPKLGFGQGFEEYRTSMYKLYEPNMAEMLGWLESHRNERFFLFWHHFEVHAPYLQTDFVSDVPLDRIWPGGPEMQTTRQKDFLQQNGLFTRDVCDALYTSGVLSADRWLGRLVSVLRDTGLYDNTMIVVTSDHGEELAERQPDDFYDVHGHTLFEEMVRVPLIIRLPHGHAAGARVRQVARTIDVMPTVLDFLGIEPERNEMQGRSLVPHWAAPGETPAQVAYIEALARRYEKKGLRTARYKYVLSLPESAVERHGRGFLPNRSLRPQLFDLEADPEESTNLLTGKPDRATKARAASFDRALRNHVAANQGEADPARLDESTVERLRSLGYLDP